jgi:hypothetical protein
MKLKLILTTAIAAAGVGGLLADQAAALPSACSQSGRTVTCTHTSGSNPFTVPAGVFSIHVVAVGGRGGFGAFDADGGDGAVVSGDLPVKKGRTLYAVVGANAPFNDSGAGGGSASDVRTSQNDLSSRLLVAGGGGGAGGLGEVVIGFAHTFSPGASGGAGGGTDGGGGGGGSNLVPPGGSQSVDATGIPLITISYIHGHL